jgi:hypothetical protein
MTSPYYYNAPNQMQQQMPQQQPQQMPPNQIQQQLPPQQTQQQMQPQQMQQPPYMSAPSSPPISTTTLAFYIGGGLLFTIVICIFIYVIMDKGPKTMTAEEEAVALAGLANLPNGLMFK